MFKRILIPTDGSDLSIQAGLRAIPLAQLSGAAVTALSVRDSYPYSGVGQANPEGLQNYLAAAQTEGRQAAERLAEAAKQAGLASEVLMVENPKASNGIVEAATQCGADLIAMGSHGRSGLAKVVLGSVAADVLALSAVPVLIFK